MEYTIFIRQHRTIRGARLAWILFRQPAQKISARRQPYLNLFVHPDEKSYFAIRTPELCGIALSRMENLKKRIVDLVRNKGEFYRVKTFIDIVLWESLQKIKKKPVCSHVLWKHILMQLIKVRSV